MASELPQILTAAEAARYLSLSVGRLANMNFTGYSPPFLKISASICYRRDDLDAWLRSRVRQSTSDPGSSDESGTVKKQCPASRHRVGDAPSGRRCSHKTNQHTERVMLIHQHSAARKCCSSAQRATRER